MTAAPRVRLARLADLPRVADLAAVISHERDAYSRHVLDGGATIADRLRAWRNDTLEGGLR